MYFDQVWYCRLISFNDCHSFGLFVVCVTHDAIQLMITNVPRTLQLCDSERHTDGKTNTELFLGALELWLMVRIPFQQTLSRFVTHTLAVRLRYSVFTKAPVTVAFLFTEMGILDTKVCL